MNKTSTRATLTVPLDELRPRMPRHAAQRLPELAGAYLAGDRLVIHSAHSRSQHANRAACVEKLAALVRRSMRPRKTRRPTRPTAASKRRRLDRKRKRSQIKHNRKRPDTD